MRKREERRGRVEDRGKRGRGGWTDAAFVNYVNRVRGQTKCQSENGRRGGGGGRGGRGGGAEGGRVEGGSVDESC